MPNLKGSPSKSEAAAMAAPATPAGVSLECIKCELPATLQSSTASGSRNPLARVCNSCVSTDKALTRMGDTGKKIKGGMKKKTKEERRDFYRSERYKREASNGAKRPAAEVASSYEVVMKEHERTQTGVEEVDEYLPFSRWALPRKLQGWKDDDLQKEWERLIKDDATLKLWRRNQWCVAEFAGVQVRDGQFSIFDSSVGRRYEPSNANELSAVQQIANEQMKKRQRSWTGAVPQAKASSSSSLEAPVIPAHLVDGVVEMNLSSPWMVNNLGREMDQADIERQSEEEELLAAYEANQQQTQEEKQESRDGPIAEPVGARAHQVLLMDTQRSELGSKLDFDDNFKAKRLQSNLELLTSAVKDIEQFDAKLAADAKEDMEGMKEAASKALQDLKACRAKLKQEWEKIEPAATAADIKSQMAAIRSACSHNFSIKCDETKNARAAIHAFDKLTKDLQKAIKKNNDAKTARSALAAEAMELESKSNLAKAIEEHFKERDLAQVGLAHGVRTTMADFVRLGNAVLLKPEHDLTPCVQKIQKMTYFASQKDWLETYCAKQEKSHAVAGIVRPAVLQTLTKEIKTAFGADFLKTCTFAPGDAAWSTEVFSFQFFFMASGCTNVNAAHFGLPEVRIILQGTLLAASIKLDVLPGNGIKEKKANLEMMGWAAFETLLKQQGTLCLALAGSVLMIPGGTLVVLAAVGQEKVHGLRWSANVGGPANGKVAGSVKHLMDELTQAFPYIYEKTAYAKWVEFLAKDAA